MNESHTVHARKQKKSIRCLRNLHLSDFVFVVVAEVLLEAVFLSVDPYMR